MTPNGKNPVRRPLVLAFLLLALCVVVSPALARDEVPAPADSVQEPSIARAVVCTSVVEREPAGVAEAFDAGVDRLYCFTEIRGQEGKSVTHAWIHEGKTRAKVTLPVRSARWRTWSSKQIHPAWTGRWEVKILDEDGLVLKTLDFVVE